MINQLKRHPRSQGFSPFSAVGARERERERERGGESEQARPGSLSLLSTEMTLGIRLLIRIALETKRVSVFYKARTTVFSYPTNWNLNLNIQIKVTSNPQNSVLCEQTQEECYII